MEQFIAILGLGIVAFAVWVSVRIVNRRERWAIRLAAVAAAASAYPMSLGPACWLVEHKILAADAVSPAYDPLLWLEFHLPKSIQDAGCEWARALRIETAYIGLRDTPFTLHYPIGDLTFRWENARRQFDTDPSLLNLIGTTVDPGSWEDLGGPGILRLAPESETLQVLQCRRVQAAIPGFLERMRSRKANVARGRDVDFKQFLALCDAHAGFYRYEADFLRSGAVLIANPKGNQLVVGDHTFADLGELLGFLSQKPRDSLRAGICWNEWRQELNTGDRDRLKKFCRARNLDLFIRPYYAMVIGQPLPQKWWVVRSSDTVYLDPE